MSVSFEKIARFWKQFHGFAFVTRTRRAKKSYPGVIRIHVTLGGKTLLLIGAIETLEQVQKALSEVAREMANGDDQLRRRFPL